MRWHIITAVFFWICIPLYPLQGNISIGVYEKGLGSKTFADVLKQSFPQTDIISRINAETLAKYNVFILPVTIKFDGEEPFFREIIREYVKAGGGFIVTHDSCGFRYEIKESLFPWIAQGFEKANYNICFVRDKTHPLTKNLGEKFQHSYYDHILLQPGEKGKVLGENENGAPILVAGETGKGRAIFMGFSPGLEGTVSEGEKKLLSNSIRWVQGRSAASAEEIHKAAIVAYRLKQKAAEEEKAKRAAEKQRKLSLLQEKIEGKRCLAGIADSFEKIFMEKEMLPEEVINSIDGGKRVALKTAGNEWENFQIILIPAEAGKAEIQIADFKGPGKFGKENVEIYQVGYVETKKPMYKTEYVGWWPDPLIPGNRFDVAEEEVQPVWISVYTPKETVPGTYTSNVKVFLDGEEIDAVAVEMEVWNFNLPQTPYMRTLIGNSRSPRDNPFAKTVADTLLKYKLSPYNALSEFRGDAYKALKQEDGTYDFSEIKKTLGHFIQKGLTAFSICGFDRSVDITIFENKEFFHFLQSYAEFLKEQAWEDKALFYCYDEPPSRIFPQLKIWLEQLHKTVPSIKRLLTIYPDRELHGYVDIWCPHLCEYDPAELRERQEAGEETWWYASGYPTHPCPNIFIDYPSIAGRIIPWLNYKFRINGFLYWGSDFWWKWNLSEENLQYSSAKTPWNVNPGVYGNLNGNGVLLYPGKWPEGYEGEQQANTYWEPLPSIRLIVLRDGIEDYDYLKLLEEQAQKNPDYKKYSGLLEIPREIIKTDLIHTEASERYTQDKEKVLKYRDKIGELLDMIFSETEEIKK